MAQIKTNDFIVKTDKKGNVVERILPPHTNLEHGLDKGYGMPHKVNGNRNDIVNFGEYARKFRKDKSKRRN